MDTIAQLETAVTALLERIATLEEENGRLLAELEQERGSTKEVRSRVQSLLDKVQEKLA